MTARIARRKTHPESLLDPRSVTRREQKTLDDRKRHRRSARRRVCRGIEHLGDDEPPHDTYPSLYAHAVLRAPRGPTLDPWPKPLPAPVKISGIGVVARGAHAGGECYRWLDGAQQAVYGLCFANGVLVEKLFDPAPTAEIRSARVTPYENPSFAPRTDPRVWSMPPPAIA